MWLPDVFSQGSAPVSTDTQMAKNRQTTSKKRHFGHLLPYGVLQLPYGNSQDTKASVYDESVYWHIPISKDTQTDTICRMQKTAKNRQTTIKKEFWSFMGILGVLQLPYVNRHAPVSKDTKTDTICRMQGKEQANNKKKGILVIYGYFRGAVVTIRQQLGYQGFYV